MQATTENTALLAAYADYLCIDNSGEIQDCFDDNYQGTYDSIEVWAEELLSETGELDAMPQHLRYYFDHAAYARDCELNGDIWTMDTAEGVAVFWNR